MISLMYKIMPTTVEERKLPITEERDIVEDISLHTNIPAKSVAQEKTTAIHAAGATDSAAGDSGGAGVITTTTVATTIGAPQADTQTRNITHQRKKRKNTIKLSD